MVALNCKPGDLAVVVRSAAGNEGKVVRCIELARGIHNPLLKPDVWRVDPPLNGRRALDHSDAGRVPYAQDCCLRPLRTGAGEDEMLRIAGLPQPQEVPQC